MGLSYDYDCASSILLCAEDTTTLLFDDDEVEDEALGAPDPKSSDFYSEPMMNPIPLQSDECLDLLIEREADHQPRPDYMSRLQSGALDPSIRGNAIDWIFKVHTYYSFGPLTACLSVNYLDRFLSAYELPKGKAWMAQLLSVACLSLAAKMEEREVPLSLDLQVGESKYVFEARTVQRMELLVLSTLKWRMQAITPFSFIDYYLHKFNDGNWPTAASVRRSGELILSMTKGIEILSFGQSEVAAAVALSVLGVSQMEKVEKDVDCCKHVEKERVLRCYEVIQEGALMRNGSSSSVYSVPMSPDGVLDAACLSYNSDDIAVGSQATSCYLSPAIKRRKISRLSIS